MSVARQRSLDYDVADGAADNETLMRSEDQYRELQNIRWEGGEITLGFCGQADRDSTTYFCTVSCVIAYSSYTCNCTLVILHTAYCFLFVFKSIVTFGNYLSYSCVCAQRITSPLLFGTQFLMNTSNSNVRGITCFWGTYEVLHDLVACSITFVTRMQ